ncbi:MAG: hypothetical protein COA74_08850 [Gammaproteobacteria bacterium]|nr:MAG: hypothetical protein COA74_08850 [Gammaproteobacteria bacterium]
MARKHGEQDKWLISTSVTLTLLALAYFFFLFPGETSSLVQLYVGYLMGGLIVILAIALTVMLYRRQLKSQSSNKFDEVANVEKLVSQIIWRNRYVLQSKKSQILYEPTLENRELWNKVKKTFAQEYVYLKIPESKVSFNRVSELIEKSLQGGAIGGIHPPTYSVKSISQ